MLLAAGGNAADAAAATIFALNVTDHGACSIGGEAPVLIFDAKRREVKALCGQGRAPLSPAADCLVHAPRHPRRQRHQRWRPVPSVVDLCITLLTHYGTDVL